MRELNGSTKYLVDFAFRPSLDSPAREGIQQIIDFLRDQANQFEYALKDEAWLEGLTWKEAIDARSTR